MNIQDAIRQRKTLKVVADENEPWPCPDESTLNRVSAILDLAGWAPFHYRCHESHCSEPLNSPVPWRFYALVGRDCRTLAGELRASDQPAGKIIGMLAAADAMVLVTWLPDPCDDLNKPQAQAFEASQRNVEHIAAAAAAVQNLLLAATAEGWNNYWSSGGILRSESVYQRLQIPAGELLLGAVFLFPQDTRKAFTKPGSLRDERGSYDQWTRFVQLDR